MSRQEILPGVNRNRDVLSNPAGIGPCPHFSFLKVKTAETSVELTWTPVGVDTGYLVFSQEVYGVYFTKKNSFRFVGLEPGRTYNVFVLAVGQGPQCIAFTAFETGA
jgi:hypothetical protein